MGKSESSHTRKLLLTGGIVLAVVLCLWFGLRGLATSGFRWDLFAATLSRIDPGWAALAAFFILLAYVGRAIRWKVMTEHVCPNARLWPLLSATVIGFTAVVFFGRPGEFVRPWLIATRQRVAFSSQLAAWFLERVYDLLSVVLLFGWALTGTGVRPQSAISPRMEGILHAGGYIALAVGLTCIGFLWTAAVFSDSARHWCDRLALYAPAKLVDLVRRSLNSFLDGMAATGNLSTVLRTIFWTVVEWLIIVACMYCVFRSFEPTSNFTWNDTLVFAGFVAFGSAIQLPGIGGGMQVAAILILTELFGLKIEESTACALLVWGFSWLIVVPFGLAFAFREGLQWKNLSKMNNMETSVSHREA